MKKLLITKTLSILSLNVLMVTCLFGCQTTIDGSNYGSFKESSKKMEESVQSNEQMELKKIVNFYTKINCVEKLNRINGLNFMELKAQYEKDFAEYLNLPNTKESERDLKNKLEALLEKEVLTKFDFINAEEILNHSRNFLADEDFLNSMSNYIFNKKQEFFTEQEYLENILVYDFKAEKINNKEGKNLPLIKFSLQNGENKTISKLSVKVYFKDKDNNIIHEETFVPVDESSTDLMVASPFKPGCVMEPEINNKFVVNKSLSNWDMNKTTLKIETLKFDNKYPDSNCLFHITGNGNQEIKIKSKLHG